MATNVVDAVLGILAELRPENVDLAEVVVTGEGVSVEIILVPHRALGGVALVLWTRENSTQLSWAQVIDLSTHDDLDLGVSVALVPHEGEWLPRLREAVDAELRRPIRIKQSRGLFGSERVECQVQVDQKFKRLGVLRPRRRRSLPDRALTEIVTSLASGPELPFSIPPPLENWRKHR